MVPNNSFQRTRFAPAKRGGGLQSAGCLAQSAAQPRGSSRHRPSKPSAFPSSRLIRRRVRAQKEPPR